MSIKWIGTAFLCTGLAFACGGGDGGGGGGDVLRENAELTCAKAFECRDSFPSDIGIAFEDIFGTTEAECVTGFDDPDLQASIDAGRVILDAADAAVCNDALEVATCPQFWGEPDAPEPPPECSTFLTGTVADGGACTISLDCESDSSFCDDATMTCGG